MAEILVVALIVLGIVGTVVPLLPGALLVAVAVVGYAIVTQERTFWLVAAAVLCILALGWVAKWWVPARTVAGDVDRLPLAMGGICALVGFFVVPFLGLVLGFLVGVFGTELVRTRSAPQAWPATKRALTAAGLSMLIELAAVVVAGTIWLSAMVLTWAT